MSYRAVFNVIALVLTPFHEGLFAQSERQKELLSEVERASLEYSLQFAKMHRYLAVVTGETDSTDDGESSTSEFHYVFAFLQGKSQKADIKRAEMEDSIAGAGGWTHAITKRQLTTESHLWVDYGDGKPKDCSKVKKEEFSPMTSWDPFSMPLNYWACLRHHDAGSYRDIAIHIMAPGKMVDADIDSQGRSVGRWRHGKPTELGYNTVVFDPKVGNMPTEMHMFDFKTGRTKLDLKDLTNGTKLYHRNETKWFQHASGKFLPSQVRCLKFRGGTSGWKLAIEWWLDDEVPDAVFTVEDMAKSHSGTSVVNQLLEQRIEQKEVANRKGRQVDEKK